MNFLECSIGHTKQRLSNSLRLLIPSYYGNEWKASKKKYLFKISCQISFKSSFQRNQNEYKKLRKHRIIFSIMCCQWFLFGSLDGDPKLVSCVQRNIEKTKLSESYIRRWEWNSVAEGVSMNYYSVRKGVVMHNTTVNLLIKKIIWEFSKIL